MNINLRWENSHFSEKYPDEAIQISLKAPNQKIQTFCFGETKTPSPESLSPHTLFAIGSVTKTFTAVLFLKLIEEGKISLSDPVSDYIDKTLDSGDLIIEDLLLQKSGLGDYTANEQLWEICFQDLQKSLSPEDIYLNINRAPKLSLRGTFQYNNSNYYILGCILLELFPSKSLGDIFRENIFSPLQLTQTWIPEELSVPREQSVAHSIMIETQSLYSMAGAGGNIFSTSSDLTSFMDNLFNKEFLSRNSIDLMTKFNSENYGMGLQKMPLGKNFIYGHDGVIPETSSMMFYHTETQITGALQTTKIDQQYACWDILEILVNEMNILT